MRPTDLSPARLQRRFVVDDNGDLNLDHATTAGLVVGEIMERLLGVSGRVIPSGTTEYLELWAPAVDCRLVIRSGPEVGGSDIWTLTAPKGALTLACVTGESPANYATWIRRLWDRVVAAPPIHLTLLADALRRRLPPMRSPGPCYADPNPPPVPIGPGWRLVDGKWVAVAFEDDEAYLAEITDCGWSVRRSAPTAEGWQRWMDGPAASLRDAAICAAAWIDSPAPLAELWPPDDIDAARRAWRVSSSLCIESWIICRAEADRYTIGTLRWRSLAREYKKGGRPEDITAALRLARLAGRSMGRAARWRAEEAEVASALQQHGWTAPRPALPSTT